MKIKDYFKSVRNAKLKVELLSIIFIILGIFIFNITAFLLFESVFYFSSFTKKLILLSISSSLLLTGFWLIGFYINIIKNHNKKYSWKEIASLIGKVIFNKKKDGVLNAFQIENQNSETYSHELKKKAIDQISQKIKNVPPNSLINKKTLQNIKIFTTLIMLSSIIIFSIFRQESSNAFYRLSNYNKNFDAPKPYKLISISQNQSILGGEEIMINIIAEGGSPDTVFLKLSPIQISLKKRDSLEITLFSIKNSDGYYNFNLPKLFQDYKYEAIVYANYFYESWEYVKSAPDTIFVTDRPKLNNFTMKLTPPIYSKLPIEIFDGSIAAIEGLKGSEIEINLESNRNLKSSFIKKRDSIIVFNTSGKKANGFFKLFQEDEFTINLVDPRGITNRDPVPYRVNIIPDNKPEINILEPEPIITLGNNQIIQFIIEIEDDYGFSNLQLAYEIQRPSYLKVEPYIAMFIIPELIQDTIFQVINTHWNLSDLMLMPGDEIHYHFELSDNNNISGPQKTVSNTYIAKVPSLAELYKELEMKEQDVDTKINDSVEELLSLKNELENMELNILKAEKNLKWEDKQKLKELINRSKEEISDIKKISEAMESIMKESEKHDLLTANLMNKFKELSQLIKDIIPKNLLEELNTLDESLEMLDLETLKNSLENFSNNIANMEKELDRYIDVFKRLQAEQKLGELKNRMEKLVQQKDKLDRDINALKTNEDASRIVQEEKRGLEELDIIKNEIDSASNLVKPFSKNSSEKLDQLKESNKYKMAEKKINETISALKKSNDSAKSPSAKALNNLSDINQELKNIHNDFQKETVSKMARKLEKTMRDILVLSKKQESLRNETTRLSRNSSQVKTLAYQQQVIQNQLNQITKRMSILSKETFSITPEMGRNIGKTNSAIEDAKSNITSKDLKKAAENQQFAMEGLNSSALNIFQNIKEMENSGSASGFEQFLKMMQQMAGKQQGLNQSGMSLGLGQKAKSVQQKILQSLLQGQKEVRSQLEKLIKEMKKSGKQQGQGNLSGIAKDMDEVISDLKNFRYTRKTKEKKRRILSRMLDSQTSLSQRGYKDQRKSISGDIAAKFKSPGGLPASLGERQNIALDALNRSLNSGYSREYQLMIKRYFNTMSQMEIKQKYNGLDEIKP